MELLVGLLTTATKVLNKLARSATLFIFHISGAKTRLTTEVLSERSGLEETHRRVTLKNCVTNVRTAMNLVLLRITRLMRKPSKFKLEEELGKLGIRIGKTKAKNKSQVLIL